MESNGTREPEYPILYFKSNFEADFLIKFCNFFLISLKICSGDILWAHLISIFANAELATIFL